jgi:DNA (cytosine-5)-methyltransferase 1
MLKAVDLFCGCGGISAGLQSAGFEILAGVDNEERYFSTFARNFPEAICLGSNLAEIEPDDLMNTIGVHRGELDVLAGGPPCQGFSKNVPRRYRNLDNPNNLLIRSFLKHCEAFMPRFVLMENVAEMKSGFDESFTNEILLRLKNAGYEVSHAVLNAANFGIPQRRRRAFFLASRDGSLPEFPNPTHHKPTNDRVLFDGPFHVSVWDAIGDLPSIGNGQGVEPCEYACKPFSEYQRAMRNGSRKVSNHVALKLRPMQVARLEALKPGQGLKDLPDHLKVNGGYSGAYGRLTRDMIAPTITRWVFHPGSGRWGHPEDVRILTIREAARIQGFEDRFVFTGTYNQQAGQLGNAVPPYLIYKIGQKIIEQL